MPQCERQSFGGLWSEFFQRKIEWRKHETKKQQNLWTLRKMECFNSISVWTLFSFRRKIEKLKIRAKKYELGSNFSRTLLSPKDSLYTFGKMGEKVLKFNFCRNLSSNFVFSFDFARFLNFSCITGGRCAARAAPGRRSRNWKRRANRCGMRRTFWPKFCRIAR